jgi:hypothetical protein
MLGDDVAKVKMVQHPMNIGWELIVTPSRHSIIQHTRLRWFSDTHWRKGLGYSAALIRL